MSSLRKLQSKFAKYAAMLILECYERGYEVTLGNAYRSPEEAKRLGFADSLHVEKLAIDINLFRDGRYITDNEGHAQLGKWWKSHGPEFRWGGDFKKKDYNHYSITPDGIRA